MTVGREDVDAEKTEIMSGTNAGDQQALLRFSGRGLFNDRLDAIQVTARRDASPADSAIADQQTLARGLNTADRAAFLLGQFDKALRGRFCGVTDIEVVAHHVQKGVAAGE